MTAEARNLAGLGLGLGLGLRLVDIDSHNPRNAKMNTIGSYPHDLWTRGADNASWAVQCPSI